MMFLHLGKDAVISLKDVIAVLDYKSRDTSPATDEFLRCSEEEGFLNDLRSGQAKSFIVTTDGVYVSSISCGTLRERALNSKSSAELSRGDAP